MAESTATVVIPNYNGRRFLPRLLDSLAAQSRDDFRIIVVDDGSTDDSVRFVRETRPDATLLTTPKNLGFAGACNMGLAAATTPFVALLNNDTHVDRNWLSAALRPFEQSDVGAVASLVLLAEPPHRIDSAGDAYTVAGGAMKRLHGRPVDAARSIDARTFSACGASAFYRRAAIEQVGGLDEALVSYYEDVELGFRLNWAGWRCVLAADSICYHHLSASYDPRGWTMHFHSARNAEIVWWSLLSPALRRKHAAAHLAFLLLQFAAEIGHGRARAFLAGKWAALRSRAAIRRKREIVHALARISDAEINDRMTHDWWDLIVRPRLRRLLGRATEP
ncbi:MAG: glycosyltransferase family 2 protein [Phycisphaerae bacterium]|nr:glycosyltransferase family 2 protein [Phycisphaerae bacterium]